MTNRYIINQTGVLLADITAAAAADTDSIFLDRLAVDYSAAILDNGSGTYRDLTLIRLTEGFRGRFSAANGGAIKTVLNQTNTGVFDNQSNASLIDLMSSSSSGVIWQVRHNPANGHTLNLQTCDCARALCQRGTLNLFADADVDVVDVWGGTCVGRTTAAAATFPVTTWNANDGQSRIGRDVGTINVRGGTCEAFDDDLSPTTVNQHGGVFRPDIISTIGTLNGHGGLFDASKASRDFTVSVRAAGPGYRIKIRRGITITFTDITGDWGGGPKIEYVD